LNLFGQIFMVFSPATIHGHVQTSMHLNVHFLRQKRPFTKQPTFRFPLRIKDRRGGRKFS
jgi:hypothetical protein